MKGGGRCTPLPPLLFVFYSKYLVATHTRKFLTWQTLLLRMPLWKKIKNFRFTPLRANRSKTRPCLRGLRWLWIIFLFGKILPLCQELRPRQRKLRHCLGKKRKHFDRKNLNLCFYFISFFHVSDQHWLCFEHASASTTRNEYLYWKRSSINS